MATLEELEFGSKLLETLRELGKKRNLSYKWNLGISILLICFTTGILEIEHLISLQWINLKINGSYLILFLSIILLFLQQNCASLMIGTTELENRVVAIYKSFISNSEIIKTSDCSSLDFPDILSSAVNDKLFSNTLLGEFYIWLNLITLSLSILLLPLIAIALAFIKLKMIFGNQWWFILIYSIMGIFMLLIIISMIKDFMKRSK